MQALFRIRAAAGASNATAGDGGGDGDGALGPVVRAEADKRLEKRLREHLGKQGRGDAFEAWRLHVHQVSKSIVVDLAPDGATAASATAAAPHEYRAVAVAAAAGGAAAGGEGADDAVGTAPAAAGGGSAAAAAADGPHLPVLAARTAR